MPSNRGGARPGAGRPQEMPDAVRTITVQVPVELLYQLDQYTAMTSRAQVIREAIALWLSKQEIAPAKRPGALFGGDPVKRYCHKCDRDRYVYHEEIGDQVETRCKDCGDLIAKRAR